MKRVAQQNGLHKVGQKHVVTKHVTDALQLHQTKPEATGSYFSQSAVNM